MTPEDFERFMRFAEGYAEANGLGFAQKAAGAADDDGAEDA